MKCGNCDKTDGLCYTSCPPKVKCTLTGKFHFYDDECDAQQDQFREATKMTGWISVEDRLPEDCEMVLVLASGKPHENITLVDAYELAEYSRNDNGGWILEMWPMWEDAKVTHWMPLPEPPEVKT